MFKKGSSGTGSKMVIFILIYFVLIFTIVPLVMRASNVGGDYDIVTLNACSTPREIYEPYNLYSSSDSNDARNIGEYRDMVSNLDCSQSFGVTDENSCLSINGCSWENPNNPWWDFWTTTQPETCTGYINVTEYDIETTSYVLGSRPYVASHLNDDLDKNLGANFGNVCYHPNVINNQSLCQLFSCSWTEQTLNFDLETNSFSPSRPTSMINTIWSTVGAMFTLRFDWGIEGDYYNQLLNLFLIYIPLIIVIFGIYVMVRA